MLDTQDTQTPAERRREATRAEILEAAWDLCREEGLAGLSLRDLAERVGMRAPSLYSYFDSKDAIYDAMFADGQRQIIEQMAPYREGPLTRDLFRAGTHAFFAFCTEDPVRYQLMFQRILPGFEPSPESYALAVEYLRQFVTLMSDAGNDDPRLIDLWTAILTGLTDQQISNDPGGDRWARLLDEAVDLFCDHIDLP